MEPNDKILKVALELFFKYGIKRITMDDIAKELGMSKKTIYQFYKEKDDLVNQLLIMQLGLQTKKFDEVKLIAKDPIHEMLLISDNMREMMQHINPVFFLDLQKFYPEAFKEFQKFKEECAFKDILRNIQEGKAAGYYREDINDEFAARVRLSQIDMLMFGNYFSFEKVSFTKSNELMLEMFVHGISTVKGHKLINSYKNVRKKINKPKYKF